MYLRKTASHAIPLLIFAILAAGSIDTDEPDSRSTSNSNNDSPIGREVLTPVGTFKSIRGDRSVAVTNSREYTTIHSGNQFIDPVRSKGGKLIAVFLTIKNTGNESGNMFWTTFKLTDSQGRKYDDVEDFSEIMAINSWAESLGLADPGDQLFPGASANTVVVFRVAPNASGLKLSVNNKKFAI